MHPVLLLVGGIVFLIDHDQAEVRIRQEQRRARAGDDAHLAGGDGGPGTGALARREFRMPFRRPHPEAFGEAIKELSGQGDLRHQDQGLPALAHVVRGRFEIDFGLARAGHPIDQRDRETAARDTRTQRLGGGALSISQIGCQMGRVRGACDRRRRQRQRFKRSLIDERIDHADADTGLFGGFAFLTRQSVGQ